DPSDSVGSFAWKIGFTLVHSGYRFSEPPESLPYIGPESLVEGLETTGSVLVVDDFDRLQSPLKRLVISLARRVKRSRVFVLSRSMVEALAARMENAYAMQLGPLDFQGFSDLLSYYGVEAGREEVEKSYKILGGIPGLAKIVARLWDGKEPLHRASKRIVRAYVEGKILEELEEPVSSIARVLASTGTSIPVEVVCKLSTRSCDQIVKALRYYGVADVAGNRVIPRRHLIVAAPRLSDKERGMLARVIRELAGQPSYLDKVRAVMVAARNCMPGQVVDMVESRLAMSENWPLPGIAAYIRSLENMPKCRNLSPREYMTFRAELFAIKNIALRADAEAIEREIDEYTRYYRERSQVIYARLLSVAGAILVYVKNRGHDMVLEALEVYRSLDQWTHRRLAHTVLPNAAMTHVYLGNLDEALKLDEELERIILESPEAGLDDYFVAKGIKAAHLSIGGRHREAYPIAVEALSKVKEYKLTVPAQILTEYMALTYMGLEMYSQARELLEEALGVLGESTARNSIETLLYIAELAEGRKARSRERERLIKKYCSEYKASFIACTLYKVAMHAAASEKGKAEAIIERDLSKMPGIAKIGRDLVERIKG
ncbi:MAG: hypothetical protein LRS43_02355, partial [Desulfurococcales archaeon]|nr:hypothetical protein [Desulfurococcales archaeon]